MRRGHLPTPTRGGRVPSSFSGRATYLLLRKLSAITDLRSRRDWLCSIARPKRKLSQVSAPLPSGVSAFALVKNVLSIP